MKGKDGNDILMFIKIEFMNLDLREPRVPCRAGSLVFPFYELSAFLIEFFLPH